MRIALIYPPWKTKAHRPPLGVAYIAAVLEERGDEVRIIDFSPYESNVDWRRILRTEMRFFHPTLVGISALSSMFNDALKIAHFIRSIEKNTSIVMGGPHASALPAEVLAHPEVDIVVRGEGEETIQDLVSAIEYGVKLERVRGISFLNDGKIFHSPDRPFIKNLDNLPFPARHLLQMDKYDMTIAGKRATIIMSSRGCPFNCIYCFKGVFGNTYRERSAKNIIAEIEAVIEDYGIKAFLFHDDTFTVNKKRVLDFCNLVKEKGLDINWRCTTRVNTVTLDLLKRMKEAGCHNVSFGVESGDARILKLIKKNITLPQVRNAFKWAKTAGLSTTAYFMIGLPWDTSETVLRTIEFAKELDADATQFALTTPFPGTELWRLAEEEGMMKLSDNWDDFYMVCDSGHKFTTPIFETRNLSKRDLKEYLDQAYHEISWSKYKKDIGNPKKIVSIVKKKGLVRTLRFFLGLMRARKIL